ncbi:MAG TPA: histidine kinase [Mycobacteriales bacterium]|nr:histidine kinase [Mycobacteriales bacterium]
MRLPLLALCAVLIAVEGGPGEQVAWLAGLAALGGVASVVRPDSRTAMLASVTEATVAAISVPLTGGAESPVLPYLTAVGFAAGVALGTVGAVLSAGAIAGTLLVGRAAFPADAGDADIYLSAAAQWATLSLIVGLVAARMPRLTLAEHPIAERYAEAYRLLDQLRAVTRSLPGSLDPGTAGSVLIERVRAVAPFQRAAVLLLTGDVFVPVALHGSRRLPWRVSLTQPGPVYTAWQRRRALVDRRDADVGGRRQGSALLVQPLFAGGDRPVGLLMCEYIGGDFDAATVAMIELIALENAPSLETAALFDELRLVAAAEERSRLAKEMHDGIAQDLAYLGYEVDAAASLLDRGDLETAAERLRELRRGMTRLASELRLSISDLRSSIGPARGVGAALADYARSAGTGTGITVHVSLAEDEIRLPADVEVAVLRIAHEAIGASRRRPGTRNLWVRLRTDPPCFQLCIDDDSESTSASHLGRSAMVIKDLAGRLGADVTTSSRPGGGVSINVWREEAA